MTNYQKNAEQYGEIEFKGKKYALTEQAGHTNSLMPVMPYHEASEGEAYKFEMSAMAIDEDENEYEVFWIFDDVKGEEKELDAYDYDLIDRVEEV